MNGHECSGRTCCADVLMIVRRSGSRQGFPSGLAHLVRAFFHKRTAALTALVEIRTALIHLCQFLPHQAYNFHAEQGIGAQELLECRRFNESQFTFALASGGEMIGLRAKYRWQPDNASRTEQALEHLSIFIGRRDRETYQPAANDEKTMARRSLLYHNLFGHAAGSFRQRFQGFEELRRELERTAAICIAEVNGH